MFRKHIEMFPRSYSIRIERDGITQTVGGLELDDFICTLERDDLLKAMHQMFDEIARLRVAAGETEPLLRA